MASFFVLPSRAHHQLRISGARVLELIAAALTELLAGLVPEASTTSALHQIQDGIGAALVGLNATGAEAERERAAHLSVGTRHRSAAADHPAAAPRRRDDRARERGAAAVRLQDGSPHHWPKSAMRSSPICARWPRRCEPGPGSPAIWPVHAALQSYAAEIASWCAAKV